MTPEVMIVEDDPLTAKIHKFWVVKSGLHPMPLVVDNGKVALELLYAKYTNTHPVILLLDINMPVMDGWTLLQKLGKNPPPYPVYAVIVTSSCNKADEERAAREPLVLGYLQKPFSGASITALIATERFKQLCG